MTRGTTYKRFCSACGAWPVCDTWTRCPSTLLRFAPPSKCGTKTWWCRQGECGLSGRIQISQHSTTVGQRTRSKVHCKFRRRTVEKAQSFVLAIQRQATLQKQIRSAASKMKDLLKVHSHYVTRVNSLRKSERALQKKLREAQTELASKRARIAQLVKSRARWRVMAKAKGRQVKSLQKNIIRIQSPPLWCDGRYSAWVRQMYFELYKCRLSEAMVNRVIRVIAIEGEESDRAPSREREERGGAC